MISTQHIEESLSVSYVNAVVANSGLAYNIRSKDYGVDGSVNRIDKINGRLMDMGSAFDCQLKATINWNSDTNNILYDIDAETYNRLIHRNNDATVPCYLVLLCLPKNRIDWLIVNQTELILKECCYFYLIEGERTKNTKTTRISIPKVNIFNTSAINNLVQQSIKVATK